MNQFEENNAFLQLPENARARSLLKSMGYDEIEPVVTEFLFRGVIQGELRRRSWARQQWLGISEAGLALLYLFSASYFIRWRAIAHSPQ